MAGRERHKELDAQFDFHPLREAALLLPKRLVRELTEAAVARRAQREAERATSAEPLPAPPPAVPASGRRDRHAVPVFDPAQVAAAQEGLERSSRDSPSLVDDTLTAAARDAGRRAVLHGAARLKSIVAGLRRLEVEMPNFAPAIGLLIAELAIALRGPPKSFRVSPMVVWGAPGVGKTRFAQAVARCLGVDFERVAGGATTAGFELSGVASGWSSARPGRIARLLARSTSACPVLMLDEIDKITGDGRFDPVSVLLELLEPLSAASFRDECLEISFDASRLVVVGTANEPERLSEPLRSRLRLVEILPPSPGQRCELAHRLAAELGRQCRVGFADGLIERLAAEESDLRAIAQAIRSAAGRALSEGRDVRASDLSLSRRDARERSRAGFV